MWQVLQLFPLLQPLVAAMGWDLLSGKTTARRKLMQLLWTSKSQVLQLEESSLYSNQSDEVLPVLLKVLQCIAIWYYVIISCPKNYMSWQVSLQQIASMEHLCDTLCYQLDLASFVACVNSGQSWNSKFSLMLSGKEQIIFGSDDAQSDSFVENFVLERLSVQSPLRVRHR